MSESARRRVVMVVDNGVRGDSRVIKSARSVQDAGYEVIVVGHGPREDVVLSGVDVRLFPVGVAKRESSISRWALRNLAMDPGDVRLHRQRMLGPERPGPLGRSALKAAVALRWRLNRWAGWGSHELEMAHTLSTKYPHLGARLGQWEQLDPWLAGIWRGLIDPIVDLQPDLIHAHDYRVLPSVVTAAKELRRQGRHVGTVYDAHEYVPGYVEIGAERLLAAMTIERTHIHSVDAVLTVSEDLAVRIQRTHKLDTRPAVVCNAPEYPGSAIAGPTLRARLGLDASTPLLVYAGSVGASRLLEQCVRALESLPGVHLALIVSHPTSNVMQALGEVADKISVSDRLHLTRYAPPDSVVDFLREADVGITPSKHSENSQDSLPTKTREYLASGVPQVVSDVRALKGFITRHGIGEVFEAENLDSMVAAIRLVLADRERYASAITQELIDQNTWESQAERLLELYKSVFKMVPPNEQSVVGNTVPSAGTGDLSAVVTEEASQPGVLLRRGPHPVRVAILPAGGIMGDRCFHAAAALPGVGVTRAVIGQGRDVTVRTRVDLVETGESAADESWCDRFLDTLARTQTHVVLEDGWGRVAGRGRHDHLAADVGLLEAHGVVAAQCLTGGDRLGVLSEDSPQDALAVSNWLGIPQFVSTPDLLAVLPKATWLPALHTGELAADRAVLERPRPVVLQLLPQSLKEEYKGGASDLLRLHDDNFIDLWALSGVPESLIPALLRKADIVVDQRNAGRYESTSLLAMGAGCLTLAPVASLSPHQFAQPVVDASTTALSEIVRDIVDRPDAYQSIAKNGPAYVERWHNGQEAERVMAKFLGTPIGGATK